MHMRIYNKMKTNNTKGYVQVCDKVICNSDKLQLETHILFCHSSCCRCYLRKQKKKKKKQKSLWTALWTHSQILVKDFARGKVEKKAFSNPLASAELSCSNPFSASPF